MMFEPGPKGSDRPEPCGYMREEQSPASAKALGLEFASCIQATAKKLW